MGALKGGAVAYGWADCRTDMPDEDIRRRLFDEEKPPRTTFEGG